MAGVESFTYGGVKIGGTSPTYDSEWLDHYGFTTNEDQAEFVCRFVVRITPSGNTATDFAAKATLCQAVEAALRKRYQKLTIDWSATNQETFDPDVNAGTFPSSGFDQEPDLRKLEEFPNNPYAQAYEFRVSLGQYPNYTDAFGAANGRRQVDVTFHYDVSDRLVVTMTGEWTQVPSALARAQFLSAFDGISGYAAYRLSKINATVPGQSSDTWTVTQKDETDPNSFSTLRFTRRYEQHVNGRRGSSVDVFFKESTLRLVTIRGTYLRTISGAGGTYGNVYGTAGSSLANFGDATNGGYAYAVTQLAALTTAQGGPLVPGQGCELLTEPTVQTNEQDDRTDYTFVFRELSQQQSILVAGGTILDDPNIVADTIVAGIRLNELNDSPDASPASAVPGPAGSAAQASPPAPAGNGGGSTFSPPPPVDPAKATNPGTQSGASAVASPVQKPIDLYVSYTAFFKKALSQQLYSYWNDNVWPLLRQVLNTQFGLGEGNELVFLEPKVDPTNCSVTAEGLIRAYKGDVVLFLYSVGRADDTGVRVDPAFSGEPHAYLVQQGLPKATMTRRVEVVFRFGSGFSLDKYVSPQTFTGWVKLAERRPNTITKTLGVEPSQGVPQIVLTYASLEEDFVWVARNVGQAGGGGGSGNSSQAQKPVDPAAATNPLSTVSK